MHFGKWCHAQHICWLGRVTPSARLAECHLHQWPDFMFDEHNTSKFIWQPLDDLSVPTSKRQPCTVCHAASVNDSTAQHAWQISVAPIHEESVVPCIRWQHGVDNYHVKHKPMDS